MPRKMCWPVQWQSQRAENAARRIWVSLGKSIYHYDALTNGHLIHLLLRLRKRAQREAQALADKDHVELGPTGWLACKPPEWDALLHEASLRDRRFLALATKVGDELYDPIAIIVELKSLRRV